MITTDQIGVELVPGVSALRNLLSQVKDAARAAGLKGQLDYSLTNSSIGYVYGDVWIGIEFGEPNCLVFATRWKLDIAAANRVAQAEGRVQPDEAAKGGQSWTASLDLSADHDAFFCKPKVEQLAEIERFLRQCVWMSDEIPEMVEETEPGALDAEADRTALRAALDRAMQDIESERVTPHEEVMRRYAEWLK